MKLINWWNGGSVNVGSRELVHISSAVQQNTWIPNIMRVDCVERTIMAFLVYVSLCSRCIGQRNFDKGGTKAWNGQPRGRYADLILWMQVHLPQSVISNGSFGSSKAAEAGPWIVWILVSLS